jgi:hypothetical protein
LSTFPKGHSARVQLERNRKIIARIDLSAHITVSVSRRFEFPNPVDMRGIPALGRGVGGTIRGTRPDAIVDAV